VQKPGTTKIHFFQAGKVAEITSAATNSPHENQMRSDRQETNLVAVLLWLSAEKGGILAGWLTQEVSNMFGMQLSMGMVIVTTKRNREDDSWSHQSY
jgi:hypothetical protein